MTRTAFTLIELLVVISIVAVLAGMLMPGVAMVRDAAQASSCRSNLRQVGMAVTTYTGDWEGLLAPSYRAAWTKIDPLGWLAWNWRGAIEQGLYMGNDKYGGTGNYIKAMGCPVQQRQYPILPNLLHGNALNTSGWATYIANGRLTATSGGAPVEPDEGTVISKIGRVSEVYLASDGFWTINNWNSTASPLLAGNWPDAPHRGATSILYLDGHVGQVTRTWLAANAGSWNVAGTDARAFWLGNL